MGAGRTPGGCTALEEDANSAEAGTTPASREEAAHIIAENDVAAFPRLRGVPGHQLEPVPWARVVVLAREATEAALGQLGRSPAALVVYHRFKLQVQQEYVGIADYVQVRVFGFDTACASDGRKEVVVPADLGTREPMVVWRPNDFPYHLDPDVEHHNVWSTRPLPEAELHKVVQRNRQGYEWVAFINPTPIQTIPSVWHAHIISRPLRQGGHANG
ncbi:hypothetical protein WJX81_005227 [Elliptochloris bilobata]|uniref:Uncharacterized protein n=1 Tax=Elliptochloris bilobata TaxID=381761 RepID=A0AAW1RQI3_9CHLO